MLLLTLHNMLYMLALAIASGFAGAYLLRLGVPLPLTILLYAGFLLLRFGLRLFVVGIACKVGFRRTIMIGVAVLSLQYLPLMWADNPWWLMGWLVCMSFGEAMYWPTFHAAVAVAGQQEKRGRQLGLRAALNSLSAVLGPLAGGFIMSGFGPDAGFGLGALVMVLSLLPLVIAPEFSAGKVPSLRESFQGMDRIGLLLFLIDGWMSAGWLSIWAIEYFVLLGSRYEAFGIANAAAGLVGFVVSLIGGHRIDRRRGDMRQLLWVSGALSLGIVLRAVSCWWPWAGTIANLSGAAVLGAYTPVLMSALYDRAKQSDGAFRFHLAIEGAWDVGGVAGHVVGAAIAWCWPQMMTLAILPALPGVVAFIVCMRQAHGHGQVQQDDPARTVAAPLSI